MRKGVIQRTNSFDGRYWVKVRKIREKPGGERDLEGLTREKIREQFSLTLTAIPSWPPRSSCLAKAAWLGLPSTRWRAVPGSRRRPSTATGRHVKRWLSMPARK